MESHALVTGLVESVEAGFGFHGCCTSLQYGTPRSRSGARRSDNVHQLPVCVHEGVAQWLPVRPGCCQTQLSRSCELIRPRGHVRCWD